MPIVYEYLIDSIRSKQAYSFSLYTSLPKLLISPRIVFIETVKIRRRDPGFRITIHPRRPNEAEHRKTNFSAISISVLGPWNVNRFYLAVREISENDATRIGIKKSFSLPELLTTEQRIPVVFDDDDNRADWGLWGGRKGTIAADLAYLTDLSEADPAESGVGTSGSRSGSGGSGVVTGGSGWLQAEAEGSQAEAEVESSPAEAEASPAEAQESSAETEALPAETEATPLEPEATPSETTPPMPLE